MNIQFCFNGDIEMIAENGKERDEIRQVIRYSSSMLVAEAQFIADFLPGYEQVNSEEVIALTGAPLISNGKDIFGYMNYQVSDFLTELVAGRTVHWTKAKA